MFTTHHKQRALSLGLLRRLGQPALIQPDKEPFTVREETQRDGTHMEMNGVRSDVLGVIGKTTASEPPLTGTEQRLETRCQKCQAQSGGHWRKCLLKFTLQTEAFFFENKSARRENDVQTGGNRDGRVEGENQKIFKA